MKLGAHMPTAGGIWKALERGRALGCEVVQLFVKNNLQWAGRPFRTEELARYRQALAASRLACVFGHTGYLINLAAPPSLKRDRSIQSLIQEIELAACLGLPFLVMHPGAHLGQGTARGIARAAAGLDEVFRATSRCAVRIALENTAGQGSCLGGELRDLAEIYERVAHPTRLGVCLDTAHLFAAGHDIRRRQGWDRVLSELDSLVGLDQLLAFHLNDSKAALGSRVDRHEHIGRGKIGREGFRWIVSDPRFRDVPGCLETPKSKDCHEDRENLARLRRLSLSACGKSGVRPPPATERIPRAGRRRACG